MGIIILEGTKENIQTDHSVLHYKFEESNTSS